MEFEAEYLGNSDMFTPFLGRDEGFSLFQGEQKSEKSYESIDNVLVEKFTDYGVGTVFEDVDSLFDNEWMTSKIDITSCFPEQLDSNFNLVGVCNEIQPSISTLATVDTKTQSLSIITALFGDKPLNIEKTDLTDTSSFGIDESVSEESVSEECGPTSPEQHVPDVDADIKFKAFLDSYLAAAKTSAQEDSPLEDPDATEMASKRKMSDPTPEGPKAKVKTPEQKQRKRLQNRNAATRYRCKKRSEQDTLNAKCDELEGENKKLQKKIESKQQEVQYLKNLIIDVFSKKHARI